MFSVIVRRIFSMIPTLLGLSLVVFLIVKAIPGDPAQLLLGDKANAQSLKALRTELGLDSPIFVQYGKFVYRTFIEGDLGRSIASSEPIWDIIKVKFPATVELAIFATFLAILIGIPLGILAADRKGSWLDSLAISTSIFGVSIPVFWLGLILIWIFGLNLGVLPMSGRMDIIFDYEPITGMVLIDSLLQSDLELWWSSFTHIILPGVTLSTIPLAFIARITRASMLEVLKEDYVRTARAKGLSKIKVVMKHALKSALPNIVTIVGLQLGALLAGAMITETVYSWPGIGTWILSSVHARDIPALEAGILLVALTYMIINLFVDIVLMIVDPRVRIT